MSRIMVILNYKQREAYETAIQGHNLLLTGSAGTGKSVVVGEIFQTLRDSGKSVQLTCSTGIACLVYPREYEATTIHQFTGIDDGRYSPSEIGSVIQNTPKYEKTLKNIFDTDVLIVDECSMISHRTFDLIKSVLELRNSDQILGGIQIIFCGDFHQLPPVPNVLTADDGSYCFQSDTFSEVFKHHIKLKENVRQNEETFITLLQEVESGVLTESGKKMLNSLRRPLPDKCGSITLFSTNDLVDEYNRNCLLQLPGDLYEISSQDSGETAMLNRMTVPKALWLKAGCPVILLRNLSNHLVNGHRGTVVAVKDSEVSVRFADMIYDIKKTKFSVFDPKKNMDIAVREQYPIKPAYALTIHKAQGMTLPWVELDCREIFKTGQLAVAMSRANSSDGLRVVNFHPRCLYKPPIPVQQFMRQESLDTLPDLTCCRKRNKRKHYDEPSMPAVGTFDRDIGSSIPEIDVEEELDDEFNKVIADIDASECDAVSFQLPAEFSIDKLFSEILISTVHTPSQEKINEIISHLTPEDPRVVLFVKKIFLKLSIVLRNVSTDEKTPPGTRVPENVLVKFLQGVHEFSTGLDYGINCIELFAAAKQFQDEHKIVTYMILEYIRTFIIQQKVANLNFTTTRVTRRYVSEASKPRIRYVAGYCVSTLYKKYAKTKKSNMFGHRKEDMLAFEEAKHAIQILKILKEEEHYIQETTNDPDSLMDTERRQNLRRGLTNVTDSFYNFFVNLTSICLSKLVNENVMKYGETMFNSCFEMIKMNNDLYEQFIRIISQGLMTGTNESVGADTELTVHDIIKNVTIRAAKIFEIYTEICQKYLMVLFAQFCRDLKDSFKLEKTMAHRKQVKVGGSSDSKSKGKKPMQTSTSQALQHEHILLASCETDESQTGNVVPFPSSSDTPQFELEDVEVICKKCKKAGGKAWIQCDLCKHWFHRNCAGLRNIIQWRKFLKEGMQFFCKDCK